MATPAGRLAQSHWNETPLYISEEERYSYYPWLYEAAEFKDHAGERVLEVGCGSGADLLQFAKHGALATGVDITDAHLELARQRVGSRAQVQYGNAAALPFADCVFDYVYSHGVIHHMDCPQDAAREILRVLKPGGRFNVHVYASFSAFTFKCVVRHGRNWKNHVENSTTPVHIDLYTARRVQNLFPGIPLQIAKYQCYRMKFLEKWLGFFLVAKGQKPVS
jgi:ubiquinone/menaquinone biosynthesis C-methylase UbiE